eukprot:TRINITY_DN1155_c0_g1_i1.p1 TRINITY_DN1155_c0_g1~~TRINITY_DN1155_c0_g1_i1.p1  ORF type:complete len:416 (+),score=99.95 TRINITY_DN1155_c0_g1_i1:83-1249(+)
MSEPVRSVLRPRSAPPLPHGQHQLNRFGILETASTPQGLVAALNPAVADLDGQDLRRENVLELAEEWYRRSGRPGPPDEVLRAEVTALAKRNDPLKPNRVPRRAAAEYIWALRLRARRPQSAAPAAGAAPAAAPTVRIRLHSASSAPGPAAALPARPAPDPAAAENPPDGESETPRAAFAWLGGSERPYQPKSAEARARRREMLADRKPRPAAMDGPRMGAVYSVCDADAVFARHAASGSPLKVPRRHGVVPYASRRLAGAPARQCGIPQQSLDLHAWEAVPRLQHGANERKYLQWDREEARRARMRKAAVPVPAPWARAELLGVSTARVAPAERWTRPDSLAGRGRWPDGGLKGCVERRRRRERRRREREWRREEARQQLAGLVPSA